MVLTIFTRIVQWLRDMSYATSPTIQLWNSFHLAKLTCWTNYTVPPTAPSRQPLATSILLSVPVTWTEPSTSS